MSDAGTGSVGSRKEYETIPIYVGLKPLEDAIVYHAIENKVFRSFQKQDFHFRHVINF